MRRLLRLPQIFHSAILRALRHDCLNLSQSTAYSAMVSLFPALIVAAALVSLLPDTAPLRFQVSAFFDRILPTDVSPLLESYFVDTSHTHRSGRALIVAFIVSLSGASGVLATQMEGVRRANDLAEDCWTFWQRRRRALLLVPLSLVPSALATGLIIFGQFFTAWLASKIMPSAHTAVLVVSLIIRWTVAFTGSIGIIGLIYHMGTPMRQSWKRVLPGAVVSTAMWFVSTLVFGWYVTRYANYSQVYGSLGAAVALLFWLFIIALSVQCGAEFNTEFYARYFHPHGRHSQPPSPKNPPPS
jgi:membrane protein